jgi:hypothetical protein
MRDNVSCDNMIMTFDPDIRGLQGLVALGYRSKVLGAGEYSLGYRLAWLQDSAALMVPLTRS